MLKIDLHIHSINSYHAYGTFYDIVKEAKNKKMDIIAITDHGPGDPTSDKRYHFGMYFRAPKINGVRVLWGAELSPIKKDGSVDLNKKYQDLIEIMLVGLHDPVEDCSFETNTKAMLNALDNPKIAIMSHPFDSRMVNYDWEQAAKKALEKNVLLELNLSYLLPMKTSPQLFENMKKMIQMAREANKKIIVGTDAHFLHEIGDDSLLKKHWKELGLEKEMIINNYPTELKAFLEKKAGRKLF